MIDSFKTSHRSSKMSQEGYLHSRNVSLKTINTQLHLASHERRSMDDSLPYCGRTSPGIYIVTKRTMHAGLG